MKNIIIKGGTIYDGSGSKPYIADLLVHDGKIQDIGQLAADGCELIPAQGLAVSPGFIDTHTHADTSLLFDRQHACSLLQGVTTEIVGMCGLGMAPLNHEQLDNYLRYSAGIFAMLPEPLPDFSTVDKYLGAIECGIHVAYSATHSAVRIAAAGFKNIPLKGETLDKAKQALRSSLDDGAVGFSTGLSYFPHYYSNTEELVDLCEVAATYDVPFLVHIRTVFANGLVPFDPTWEAMEVAKRTGIKLHVLHIKTGWPETAGNIAKVFEPYYAKAAEEGVDISFELYPYHTGSGYAVAFIPHQYTEGGYFRLMDRLADQATSRKILADLERIYHEIMGDADLVLTHLKKNEEYIGLTIKEVAKRLDMTIPETVIKLLYDNDLAVGFRGSPPPDPQVNHMMDKDILDMLMMPNYMVGSDSIPIGDMPHPRMFGTFPKILRLTREFGYPLQTIINRMTKLPASRYQLGPRGELKKGFIADIAVFDPGKVADTATWEIPRNAPVGIPFVLVNGKVAVRDGKPTGILAGRGIRRFRA
jgi:N-acyl-D-amino-acid deacylase